MDGTASILVINAKTRRRLLSEDTHIIPANAGEKALNQEPAGRAPKISIASIMWPIILGLGAVSIIGAATFEPDMFSRMWRTLNPLIMLGAVGMVLARILFGGIRLSYISHGRLSFWGGIKGQLAWDFASNITPSLVGGAPIAAYYITKQSSDPASGGIRFGEVTALVMFIMLLDQTWFTLSVPVLLVAAMFMDVIPSSAGLIGSYVTVLYLVLFMIWTLVFGYATLFRPELLTRFVDWVCRIWFLRKHRERAKMEMKEYQKRAGVIRSQPVSFFATGLLLSALTWTTRYALVVFIVWSVHPALDQILLLMRSIAMTISALIVPTPGGAGGIEALYALFFASLMPRAFLAPTLFVWRFLGYYIFLGIGILMSTHQVHKSIKRRKKKKAIDRADAPENEPANTDSP